MWEKIEARLAEESKEVLNIHCEKSAKSCRDKINNLSKKDKNVKDKRKMTGEGSKNIKSFPEFDELDQIWGTRDSVNPKYVMEAWTSKSVIATPSPNSSMSSSGSGDGTSFGPLEDSSDEMDETLSLPSAIARPTRREKTEKGRRQEKKKRNQPSNDDDSKKDEDLEYSSSLFFKKKQKQPDSYISWNSTLFRTNNLKRRNVYIVKLNHVIFAKSTNEDSNEVHVIFKNNAHSVSKLGSLLVQIT